MRKSDSPAIFVVASLFLLVGTALSEPQPPRTTPALAFPAVLRSNSAPSSSFRLTASTSTATSSITSLPPYFRDEDFFILDYDDNNDNNKQDTTSTAAIRKSAAEQRSLVVPRRILLHHQSRHVRRAIASAWSGILAGVMSRTTLPSHQHSGGGNADNSTTSILLLLLPTLAAAAFLASTVWIKTVRMGNGGFAPTFEKGLENDTTMDEMDTVPATVLSDKDDGSSSVTTLLKSASIDTGTNVNVEQTRPHAALLAAETSTEKAHDTISKEQYNVVLEEVTNLKTQLQETESKMAELQEQLIQYELLQKKHDMELQEAVQRERLHGQERVRTMQRAMVSVMKKERDDLVADFQKQAALLKGMLLNEES